MDNLPEIQSEQPPVPPPDGWRELVAVDGEVYLPLGAPVSPGTPEYAAVVAEVLPDHAASLSDEALRRPQKYSVWAIILILLFFGALAAAIFFMRPRVRLEVTSMKVPPPEVTSYVGEFSRDYEAAMACVKAKRYKDARKCLSPVVGKLLERGEAGRKNEPIYYSYFDLFVYLGWDAEAEKQLKRLIALDDQYRWEFFDIVRQLAAAGGEEPGKLSSELRSASRKTAVDSLYGTMEQIDKLTRKLKNDPGSTKWLDLYKCHFGLKVWRRLNQPVTNDEFGEADREEVWRIASKYPKDANFIRIRKYLVNRLILDDPGGHYKFDGRKYYWNSGLKRFLRKIDRETAGQRGK